MSERDLLERATHDLKNPLAVVRSTLEWLEVELAGSENLLDAVHDASTATTRLMAIVDDLQLLAGVGDDVRSAAPVLIGDVVEQAAVSATSRLAAKQIAVTALPIPAAAAKASVRGDVALLSHAVLAVVDAVGRGAPRASAIDLSLDVASGSGVEIFAIVRGDARSDEPADPLSVSGISVFVASRIAAAHGGELRAFAGATVPSIAMVLPTT